MNRTDKSPPKRRIGLALGSGAARGLAHIGVIHELEAMGVKPDLVAGASIGALVAAAYVTGHLQTLEEWLGTLSTREIIYYMDLSLLDSGGFADAGNLIDYFKQAMGNPNIEDLEMPFVAVATDMHTGREIWLREGPIWDAVRASIGIPGLLSPVRRGYRYLVDGGVVNPVPVSACRALDADIVIAVNLNSGLINRKPPAPAVEKKLQETEARERKLIDRMLKAMRSSEKMPIADWLGGDDHPNVINVISQSITIMQDRITRSRLAGEPPEILLNPHVDDIGILEFDRVDEAVDKGRRCVRRRHEIIRETLGIPA